MACYCGGCRDCLAAQGFTDIPTHCVVCDKPLDDDNDRGVCSRECERKIEAAHKAEATALALELHEADVLAKIL